MPRERVLVLLHGDGFVAVHVSGNPDVKIVRVPYLPDDGIAGEIVGDEYLEGILPAYWAELLKPGYAKRTEIASPLTVAEITDLEHKRAMYDAVDVIAQKGKESTSE